MNQSLLINSRRMSQEDQDKYRLEMASRSMLWDSAIESQKQAEVKK